MNDYFSAYVLDVTVNCIAVSISMTVYDYSLLSSVIVKL